MKLTPCRSPLTGVLSILLVLYTAGCESAYYGALEKVGIHKRDLVVDRVEEAIESQEEAKAEFQNALEQFASVVNIEPSGLRAAYDRLNDAFEDAETRARAVTERIDAVEDVTEDLFEEWRTEAAQISNARLRASSTRQLQASERQYQSLLKAMRRAEASMQPVLTSFRDHVLYLKHNLNAQAIASLEGELIGIESDVGALVREMEAAIAEAQAFIDGMDPAPPAS